MKETINNNGYEQELSAFFSYFTIQCPACNSKTVLINKSNTHYIEGKIVCSHCAFNKNISENDSYEVVTKDELVIISKIIIATPQPLKIVLWYSKAFRGYSFWAYNDKHLEFLYDFINAKHRTRNLKTIKNRSIGSRLPKWMTSSSNRIDISKLIQEMLK